MRPKEVWNFLKATISDSKAPAVFLWGAPGIGKSSVCAQLADHLDIGFLDMRLAQRDPTDLRGALSVKNDVAVWLKPEELPQHGEGILLLDELPLAPPLVQSAAFQLVLDRKIDKYVLPKGWRIFAAGNKAKHGVHMFKMSAPLRNRFVHINYKLHVNDWNRWAMDNNIKSDIIEFINFRNDFLYQFDPERDDDAFPTPRTWEFASNILKYEKYLKAETMEEAVEGTVGPGAAGEFYAYRAIKKDLPATKDILKGENFVPKQIDIACALATSLVVGAEAKDFGRILEYSDFLAGLDHFSEEIAVLTGKLLAMKDKDVLVRAPGFSDWSKKYWPLIAPEE